MSFLWMLMDAFIILTVCVVFSHCLCSIYVCVLSVLLFSGRCFIGAEDVKCGGVFLWFVGVPCVLYCTVRLPPGESPFAVIIINNNNNKKKTWFGSRSALQTPYFSNEKSCCTGRSTDCTQVNVVTSMTILNLTGSVLGFVWLYTR
jgi:hypothetical protein